MNQKKRNQQPEHVLCKSCMALCDTIRACKQALLCDFEVYHLANEMQVTGNRQKDMMRAARLKEIGVRPGLPDYLVLWEGAPNSSLRGIGFVEVKARHNKLSAHQEDFLGILERFSIRKARVVRSLADWLVVFEEWGIVRPGMIKLGGEAMKKGR